MNVAKLTAIPSWFDIDITLIFQIKFSVMHPGVHVWPHNGPTNCRIRAHLGLVVPDGPRIRVTDKNKVGTYLNCNSDPTAYPYYQCIICPEVGCPTLNCNSVLPLYTFLKVLGIILFLFILFLYFFQG